MNTSLVHFLTTDHLRLPGLLYEPEKNTDTIAIFLHGNGSSSVFYKPEMNIFAHNLTTKGISFFPFNNRGAHYIKSLTRQTAEEERIRAGSYYELIKDCIKDMDGALDFLKSKGYKTFYLIGHSTGANKIVVYHYYKQKNDVARYVLLAGGDDTGLFYQELGKERFYQVLRRAQQEIEKGNGEKIVPSSLFPEPYSYQSIFDILNPDGDYNIFPFNEYINNLNLSTKELFREYKTINKPTLVLYGEYDEFCYNDVPACIETLKKLTTRNSKVVTFKLIKDTNHGFDGKEEELGTMLADWLSQ